MEQQLNRLGCLVQHVIEASDAVLVSMPMARRMRRRVNICRLLAAIAHEQQTFPCFELFLQEFDHYCVWLNNTIGPLSKLGTWGDSVCAWLD